MQSAVRHYAIVTAAYWGFTLTDGALRMLVLLHFYRLGYSSVTLAFLFLLYEAAGILANLIGGWLATRYGITRMLTVGLLTQITGLGVADLPQQPYHGRDLHGLHLDARGQQREQPAPVFLQPVQKRFHRTTPPDSGSSSTPGGARRRCRWP